MKIHEISSGMAGLACHNDPDILPLNHILTLMSICELSEKFEEKKKNAIC